MIYVEGISGCLGLIQKSMPSQKLYACRVSNKERAIANAIHSRILELVESVVKSRNNSDKRKIATTTAVVAT